MKEHTVTPFCKEVRILEEEFKNCQKLTAVGDENRQHLLCVMLNCPIEGVRVTEITEMTHLSRPTVSHHMQILKDAGIVRARKEGTTMTVDLGARFDFVDLGIAMKHFEIGAENGEFKLKNGGEWKKNS